MFLMRALLNEWIDQICIAHCHKSQFLSYLAGSIIYNQLPPRSQSRKRKKNDWNWDQSTSWEGACFSCYTNTPQAVSLTMSTIGDKRLSPIIDQGVGQLDFVYRPGWDGELRLTSLSNTDMVRQLSALSVGEEGESRTETPERPPPTEGNSNMTSQFKLTDLRYRVLHCIVWIHFILGQG